MGWFFGFDWTTRESLVKALENNFTYDCEHGKCKVISIASNGKWWLCELIDKSGTVRRHIVQCLIDYDRKDKCYGYKDIDFESGPSDLRGLPRTWLKDPLVGWGDNERYPYYKDINESLNRTSAKFIEPKYGEEIMTNDGRVIHYQHKMTRKGLKYRYIFSDGFRWDKNSIERGRKNLQQAKELDAKKEVKNLCDIFP
jgi:hypothetical protein